MNIFYDVPQVPNTLTPQSYPLSVVSGHQPLWYDHVTYDDNMDNPVPLYQL